MNLITNSQFITRGGRTVFSGIAGVAPYVYSVEVGGIGGSIDALGVYTAPYAYGTDTIKVVDANLDEDTMEVHSFTHIQLITQIIQKKMALPVGRVWVFNQKIDVPRDKDLFIVLREMSCKTFSNNLRMIDGVNHQVSTYQAQMSIDIESGSMEALQRKEEVVMALRSQYSENQQTLNSFKIGSLPTAFVNLSELEASAIPYRYNITINVLYSKVFVDQDSTYYDTFELEVDTNSGDHVEIELEGA